MYSNNKKTNVGFPLNIVETSPDVDFKYGPYANVDDALNALGENGSDCICAGLKFGVTQSNGTIKEYKFKKGIANASDLICEEELISQLKSIVGELSSLSTTEKTSLVAAINEVKSTGGGAIEFATDDDIKSIFLDINLLKDFKHYATFSSKSPRFIQGGDVYNNYFIQLFDGCEQINIYDLFSGELQKVVSLQQYNSYYHCNNVTFGDKYDVNDLFPLLYVSMQGASNDRTTLVIRLIGSSITSLTGQIIQTIHHNARLNGSINQYFNTFTTPTSNYMYIFGENDFGTRSTFAKLRRPSVDAQEVYIEPTDIVEEWTTEKIEMHQDAVIFNNKLFIFKGNNTEEISELVCVNLTTHSIVGRVNLASTGEEFESVGIQDNKIYSSTLSGKLYVFNF